MGWMIPNSTDIPAKTNAQYGFGAMGKLYSADTAILEMGLEGTRPISGCQLVPGTTTGTVKVNAGIAGLVNAALTVAAQDNVACIVNADATNPKWILYELDTAATLQANVGAAAANPIIPTPTPGRAIVGAVFMPATAGGGATAVDTAISSANGNAKIIDKRAMRNASVTYDLFRPVYNAVFDGVTRNTSTTWNGGALNLNTLTGTQNATLTSTAGLPTSGAVVLTKAATDYVITYNGISGNNLQNATLVGVTGPPSIVVANGDPVSNNKIITSATSAWTSNMLNAYVNGSTDLVVKNTATTGPTQLIFFGSIPGGGGQWGQLSQAVSGAHTGQTFVVAQVGGFQPTPLPGARSLDIWAIAAGGGGASGANGANTTTNTNGGGGGGPGGIGHWPQMSATDIWKSGGVGSFTVGQGGRGGATAGGASNPGSVGGSCGFASAVLDIWTFASGGVGGTGTTGGAQGAGTVLNPLFVAGNGSVGGGAAATAAYSARTSGGFAPGGGGGGGGLTGSGSVYLAATAGGSATSSGFLNNGNIGGGPGGQGVAGGAGGDFLAATEFPNSVMPGSGGGGGGGRNTTGNGGAGGVGGVFGGGGGGGGNGVAGLGGAGGDGGDGCVLVVQYA